MLSSKLKSGGNTSVVGVGEGLGEDLRLTLARGNCHFQDSGANKRAAPYLQTSHNRVIHLYTKHKKNINVYKQDQNLPAKESMKKYCSEREKKQI